MTPTLTCPLAGYLFILCEEIYTTRSVNNMETSFYDGKKQYVENRADKIKSFLSFFKTGSNILRQTVRQLFSLLFLRQFFNNSF